MGNIYGAVSCEEGEWGETVMLDSKIVQREGETFLVTIQQVTGKGEYKVVHRQYQVGRLSIEISNPGKALNDFKFIFFLDDQK